MKNIKIVLVKPHYEENIGMVARAIKNFGFRDLWLINPIAEISSAKTISRAMHAQDILKKAKIFKNIEEVKKKVDLSIGTTAKISNSKIFRSALFLEEFAELYANSKNKIAIFFGPEPSGLSNTELKEFDFLVNIPCSPKYKTMNLAQSVAVVLYSLFIRKKRKKQNIAGKNIRNRILETVKWLLPFARLNNPELVFISWKALLGKTLVNEKEASAILAFLKGIKNRISEFKKN